MIWQFVVLPGTHTVTVVNKVLTSGLVLVGPASTTTPTTLEPVGVGPTNEPVLPPPPPQESADQQRAAHSPTRHARDGVPSGANPTTIPRLLPSPPHTPPPPST